METMTVRQRAGAWYENFNRFADDLYPGHYTHEKCFVLAEQAEEFEARKKEKGSLCLAHYYTAPENHEIADKLGDSLVLSQFAKDARARRIDFLAVAFMAETAKMLNGDHTRIYVPKTLGCSLVFGTDIKWVKDWRQEHPKGIIISYINSGVETKALSQYTSTSRNTDKIIAHSIKKHRGAPTLFLPDKYLGNVMKQRALRLLTKDGISINPDLIEIYDRPFGGYNACCYVHEPLGHDALLMAMIDNPDAVAMIHPECGCSSMCLRDIEEGRIPEDKAFFFSTEQMLHHARTSSAQKFIVATEPGLIYALRKAMPEKTFIPVSAEAHCKFMKGNTLEGLLQSLKEDKYEIVITDDPTVGEVDGTINIPRSLAVSAAEAINNMLLIQ